MSRNENARRHRRTGSSASRSHQRGFSHPARFEVLEQRLPLAAVTAGVVEPNGVELVPGLISGNNPAQPVLVASNPNPTFLPPPGDNVAFNTPSWIPNDRTLTPIPFANESDLPMNIYQVARSPRGVRNFEIGANTSLAHGASPPMGRNISAVIRPSPIQPKFVQAIERPLDDALLEEDLLGGSLLERNAPRQETPDEVNPMKQPEFAETLPSVVQTARRNPPGNDDNERLSAPQRSELELQERAAYPSLDKAAVDQTMAAQEEAVWAPISIASHEVAAGRARRTIHDESAGIHAAAASLTMGVMLVEPGQNDAAEWVDGGNVDRHNVRRGKGQRHNAQSAPEC